MVMKIKIINDKKNTLHEEDVPDYEALKTRGCSNWITLNKPYLLQSIMYLHNGEIDEFVVSVKEAHAYIG